MLEVMISMKIAARLSAASGTSQAAQWITIEGPAQVRLSAPIIG